MISPWPDKYWAYANFWEMGIVMLLEGMISTVWFMWGGIRDVKAMFKALEAKVTNQLDNGMVVNGVALADKERFDKIDCK